MQSLKPQKTQDDTKQLFETYKKCPEMMVDIFNQLFKAHPTEQRHINIHACVLSKVACCPLMLSNPFGYVKLVSHGETLSHPEAQGAFKPDMAALLELFWGFKMAIEAVTDTMIRSKYNNSRFKRK